MKLSTDQRNSLQQSSFAIPESRSYPIHDENHARNALGRVAQFGSESDKVRVKLAVKKKFPNIHLAAPRLKRPKIPTLK